MTSTDHGQGKQVTMSVTTSLSSWRRAIALVEPHAGKSGYYPLLDAVHVFEKDGRAVIEATDRFTIARVTIDAEATQGADFVVRRDAILRLAKLAAIKADGNASVRVEKDAGGVVSVVLDLPEQAENLRLGNVGAPGATKNSGYPSLGRLFDAARTAEQAPISEGQGFSLPLLAKFAKTLPNTVRMRFDGKTLWLRDSASEFEGLITSARFLGEDA